MKYFDCHADTLTKILRTGENLAHNLGDYDLNRVEQFARQYGQVFAIWRDRKQMDMAAPEEEFRKLYGRTVALLEEEKERIVLCKSGQELADAFAQGKSAAILAIEDASIMGSYIERIRELGIRVVLLTWNHQNEYGYGSVTDQKGGLKPRGRELVRRLSEEHMILDVSHLSDRGVEDLLELTERPVVATHSNVRAVCDHPRNLTRNQIQEIIARGGLIGMNFYRKFLGDPSGVPIDKLFAHMDYILNLGGENVLALGGDLDGCNHEFPEGFVGVESIPWLWEEMARAGFSESLMEKVFFQNAYSFMEKHLH